MGQPKTMQVSSENPGKSGAKHQSAMLRSLCMLAICIGCVLLLRHRLADLSLSDVWAAMAAIPVQSIFLALVLGALSHAALAGYDILALRRIGRQIPWPRALAGGFSGTVFSQVLGFGMITGSFARARIYRANGIEPSTAIALSGLVAAGFFSGLCVLLAFLMLIDPSPATSITGIPEPVVRLAAAGILITAYTACRFASGKTLQLPFIGLHLKLPDLGWLTGATTLATADLIPAALCLAVMLPSESIPNIAGFVAIYITALALGHLIGSPGGAGPFEGVLFMSLSTIGADQLAAAILMYRLTYYMPAFILAVSFVITARRSPTTQLLTGSELRDRINWILDDHPDPETELLWLGDKHIYFPASGTAFVSYGIAGRIWLVMGDPIGPKAAWSDLIHGLEQEARAAGANVAIYKASKPSVDFWQQLGWHLQPLGHEGTLSLSNFDLNGRKYRELRRKCKNVDKAGVEIRSHAPGELPIAAADLVAKAWLATKNGHEQTFSMGHWTPIFASRHHAVSAWLDDQMIAFATFWRSGNDQQWMLDLMRQTPDTPNGTMHRLIAQGIFDASQHGADTLNLCMAPMSGLQDCTPTTRLSRIAHHLYVRYDTILNLQGKRRFKDIFRPEWTPRYLATQSYLSIPEALIAANKIIENKAPKLQNLTRSPLIAANQHPIHPYLPTDEQRYENSASSPSHAISA